MSTPPTIHNNARPGTLVEGMAKDLNILLTSLPNAEDDSSVEAVMGLGAETDHTALAAAPFRGLRL